MEWRSFNQRIITLMLLGALVIGLIAGGLEPYVALSIATAIVLLLKDVLLPGGNGGVSRGIGQQRRRGALPPAGTSAEDDETSDPSGDTETPEGEGK
ncbi:hypothetical protein [Streptomyces rochei]|uniref:hypothetical protein n=1 Tax=Streptomyces rochei TaxID=1928 RepID=UPI003679F402